MFLPGVCIFKRATCRFVSEMNGSCIKSEHLKKILLSNILKSKDINNGMALSIYKQIKREHPAVNQQLMVFYVPIFEILHYGQGN